MVSTLVSAAMPEDAPALADFMCHSSAMQQSTYNELIKTSQHVRISNIVKKALMKEEFTAGDFKDADLGIL